MRGPLISLLLIKFVVGMELDRNKNLEYPKVSRSAPGRPRPVYPSSLGMGNGVRKRVLNQFDTPIYLDSDHSPSKQYGAPSQSYGAPSDSFGASDSSQSYESPSTFVIAEPAPSPPAVQPQPSHTYESSSPSVSYNSFGGSAYDSSSSNSQNSAPLAPSLSASYNSDPSNSYDTGSHSPSVSYESPPVTLYELSSPSSNYNAPNPAPSYNSPPAAPYSSPPSPSYDSPPSASYNSIPSSSDDSPRSPSHDVPPAASYNSPPSPSNDPSPSYDSPPSTFYDSPPSTSYDSSPSTSYDSSPSTMYGIGDPPKSLHRFRLIPVLVLYGFFLIALTFVFLRVGFFKQVGLAGNFKRSLDSVLSIIESSDDYPDFKTLTRNVLQSISSNGSSIKVDKDKSR